MKRVIVFFRRILLFWVIFYLDDLLAQNMDPKKLESQTRVMIIILHLLGFRVNFKKSDLSPSQKATYLGFEFDTLEMTVSLPWSKVEKIQSLASSALFQGSISVKKLQKLMGTLESSRPAVRTAPLHYRKLQELLVRATKKKWPMKRIIPFPPSAQAEPTWWRDSLPSFRSSPMRDPPVDISIWSDAVTKEGMGWGGYSSEGRFIQGTWSDEERDFHINVLETIAAHRVMDALLGRDMVAAHYIDNTTSVAYIRNFGGARSKGACREALVYWDLILNKNSWVIPAHIAGVDNVMADYFSRHAVKDHDYGLRKDILDFIFNVSFFPQFDLFASQDLHVCERWASFCWTKDSSHGDAFLINDWPDRSFIFPPPPLLVKVVARLVHHKGDFILVAPAPGDSAQESWFPILSSLLVRSPLLLGKAGEICRTAEGKSPPKLRGSLAAYIRSESLVQNW